MQFFILKSSLNCFVLFLAPLQFISAHSHCSIQKADDRTKCKPLNGTNMSDGLSGNASEVVWQPRRISPWWLEGHTWNTLRALRIRKPRPSASKRQSIPDSLPGEVRRNSGVTDCRPGGEINQYTLELLCYSTLIFISFSRMLDIGRKLFDESSCEGDIN